MSYNRFFIAIKNIKVYKKQNSKNKTAKTKQQSNRETKKETKQWIWNNSKQP